MKLMGVIAAMLLVMFGARMTWAEYRAARFAQQDVPSMLVTGQVPGWARASSRWGRGAQLRRCLRDQGNAAREIWPTELVTALDRACDQLAQYELEQAPASSLAHLVMARAHAQNGAVALAHDSLDLARAGAPNVQWLALERLRLGLLWSDPPSEGARQDLHAVLRSGRMAPLAALYRDHPDRRAWIEDALQSTPEAQADFVAALREGGI